MNRDEQKELIRCWLKREAERLCDLIDRGKVPEDWDGHEFGEYLASRFGPPPKMLKRRLQEYRRALRDNQLF